VGLKGGAWRHASVFHLLADGVPGRECVHRAGADGAEP
jgi:hypothetical protein